jgi:type IV pilus assembly protein PilB
VRKKIGECLIQAGLISEDDLRLALAEHKRTSERLGAVLVRMSLATDKQIAKALAYQLGFSYVSLVDEPPDPAVVVLIPKAIALKRACIAIRLEKNLLTVAMSDPLLFSLVQDLEFQTGYRIKQVVATESEIIDAIHACYPDKALARLGTDVLATRRGAPSRSKPSELALRDLPESAGSVLFKRTEEPAVEPDETRGKDENGESAPIVDLVDLIVQSAVRSRASDVHIEPLENTVLVRHRLDGLLKEVMDLPKWVHEGLTTRLKVMAGMDISEKRLPQDGRIRVAADDETPVDFRVSSLRTLFGEKIVLRVLDHRKGVPALEEIGLSTLGLDQFRHFFTQRHGMILVVGPTGSGKTTTLASALGSIRSECTNIITIEDPIEYQLPGINQTQVNERIKLTFASSLRSILRQDPDVILVGEIRDAETARIAMQAAQTGHLVLSTLHTEDGPSTMTRLMDLGIEPYIIASVMVGVVAQRLVRRLCLNCRRQYTPTPETTRLLNLTETDAASLLFYHPVGCDQCSYTGYRGRVGIYEVMPVSGRLRRLITERTPEDNLREAACQEGMVTLGEDGLAKVKAGVTTADELLRVVTDVREVRTVCPGCSGPIGVDFMVCPHCGRRLISACPRCRRAVQPSWSFCPYCAADADARRKPRQLPNQDRRELPGANVAEFKKA